MLRFELFNHDSGNAVAEFDTMEDALAGVRLDVSINGIHAADDWTLTVTDGESTQSILVGVHLTMLAFAGGPPFNTTLASAMEKITESLTQLAAGGNVAPPESRSKPSA